MKFRLLVYKLTIKKCTQEFEGIMVYKFRHSNKMARWVDCFCSHFLQLHVFIDNFLNSLACDFEDMGSIATGMISFEALHMRKYF